MNKRGRDLRRRLRWLVRPSPAAVVLIVAALVVGSGAAANCVGSRDAARYPEVVYVDGEGKPLGRSKAAAAAVSARPVFGGEVYQTTVRLGEASAVAGGAILYAAGEGLKLARQNGGDVLPGLPSDHGELLTGMSAGGVLPGGLSLQSDLRIVSPTSVLTVRYQRNPLSVEVVSVALRKENGPALLIRLPDDSPGGE